MATKKATERAKATAPVDASSIPQDGASEKPSREALAKSGYTIPEHWEQLENGEPVETADATSLSEVNRDADKAQRESLKAAEGHTAPEGSHKSYTGHYGTQPGGAKSAEGPAENKSAKK